MIKRIRIILLVYTVALLAGSFGISFAVFEWRDGDQPPVQAGPTQAELDAQRCVAALEAAGNTQPTDLGLSSVIIIPEEIQQAIDRYCR
jgi:hypothetical protein